ncbi:IPT/TIG domain-containing protein, partial [Thermodesulfobacteriota bacterium]
MKRTANVKRLNRYGIPFSILLMVFLISPAVGFGALQFTDMSPVHGPVGTEVILSGTGFDPGETYSVLVDGLPCTVNTKTADSISFIIPPGATSGEISVQSDETIHTHYYEFTVTRILTGQWNPPAGFSRDGYITGSLYGEGTLSPDGTIQIPVMVSGVTTAAVAADETDPGFFAIVTSGDAFLTIDTLSTATALIFFSPHIATQDDIRAQSVITRIAALPETAQLASRIEAVCADGSDYLVDAQMNALLQSAMEAYLADPVLPQSPGRTPMAFEADAPEGTHWRYFNPPADELTGPWLESTLTGPGTESPDFYNLCIEGKEGTPLDWSCLLYEVDPAQFTRGLPSVDEWYWKTSLDRIGYEELEKNRVGSKLISRYLDLIDLALGEVFSVDKGDLQIPAHRPGVYVSRAYSGNLFYGSEWWDYNRYQGAFIDGLSGGRQEWNRALYGNMAVAVLDAVAVIVSIRKVFEGKDFADLLFTVTYEVEKAIAALENRNSQLS